MKLFKKGARVKVRDSVKDFGGTVGTVAKTLPDNTAIVHLDKWPKNVKRVFAIKSAHETGVRVKPEHCDEL